MASKWYHADTMAMTLRLPEDLQREARDYARWWGMSINALVALALRERMERAPVTKPGRTTLVEAPKTSRQERRKREREAAKAASKRSRRR